MAAHKVFYSISTLMFLCFTVLGQPEKGKPGSKESYKVQEYYNVQAENQSIKEGPYELWYKGVKLVRGNFSNDEKDGLWKFTNLLLPEKDVKGKVVDSLSKEFFYQGYYKQNKKNGSWKYYVNQKPLCTIYYKDNLRDSTWKSFYSNGKLRYLINYNKGLKNGLYEYYLSNGIKLVSNEYSNDLLNGHYTRYNNDGKIQINIEYKAGIPYTVIALNDNLNHPLDPGTLKDGTGALKYYDKDNRLERLETYKNGVKDGLTEIYYPSNGNIHSKGTFSNGKMNDDWIYLKQDGSKEKTIVINNPIAKDDTLKKVNDADFVTMFAEYRPQPQGGDDELQSYFESNLPYKFNFFDGTPQQKYNLPTSKNVAYVNYAVSATGNIYHLEFGEGFSKEQKEDLKGAFRAMPPWVPAFNDGFPVEFLYKMVITIIK
jgi:antitoxin component YwqK of YwqJK toxin-antitoxin module